MSKTNTTYSMSSFDGGKYIQEPLFSTEARLGELYGSAIANQQRPTAVDREMSARQGNFTVEEIQKIYDAYRQLMDEQDRQRQQLQDEAIRERQKEVSAMLSNGLFGNPFATLPPSPQPKKPPEPEVIPIADQIGPRVIQFDE